MDSADLILEKAVEEMLKCTEDTDIVNARQPHLSTIYGGAQDFYYRSSASSGEVYS